jgi:cell division protein FtsW
MARTTAKTRNSAVSTLSRNPLRNVITWFDSYFLNQSKLFKWMMRLIIFMVAVGLVMVLSASNVNSIKSTGDAFAEFKQQAIYAIIGLVAMLIISMRSVETIQKYSRVFFFGALGAQLAVLLPGLGVSVGGNRNWLNLGFATIQPSEFLKLGIILVLASLLAPNLDRLWDYASGAKHVLFWGFLPAILVLVSAGDLGTAAVMVSFIFVLMYLIGMPSDKIMVFLGLAAFALFVASVFSANRMARILAFFAQGTSNVDGADWQVTHGTWALASGGLFGTGLGESKMKWGWIPEVENDFIFSIIGEEVGLIGAVVILFCFFLLARFLRQVSLNSKTDFGSIAVTGIMLWILIQALVNIAVVLHLFPVLGVPLPLFSKGGSSLVAVLMALGVVLAIERDRSTTSKKVRSR